MKRKQTLLVRALVLATLLVSGVALAQDGGAQGPAAPAEALTTGFTYQGQLDEGGSPVNDICIMNFKLYDAASMGAQVGSTINTAVPIADGLFTVTLDFGAGAFNGDRRWLGIEVDCEGGGAYADLGRQELTAAPYALHAMSAPWSGLAGIPSGFADGVDDDTTYTAGFGLTLDGVTFDVVTSTIQQRVMGACGAGYAIRQVNADGSVTCEEDTDTDTTYSAGIGLDLTGTTFDVTTSTIQQRVTGACGAGYAIRQVNADGSVTCEQDDDTTYTAGAGLVLNGTEFSAESNPYANVIVVAQSGGDYSSVQAAIDSITDAAEDNSYLVWVAPGVYVEQVTMKPYVHLQGAGQEATVISSTISSSWPPSQATLVLTRATSLHDLTVGNSGTGLRNTALLATAGTTRTLVAGVTVQAQGSGSQNYAIFLLGSGTGVFLQDVTALAENGSNANIGLYNYEGAAAVLRGGSFTGRGGNVAYGIYNYDIGTTLEAESVTALAEGGSSSNCGLNNSSGAEAVLRSGSFTGRGEDGTRGIDNSGSDTMLEATSVTALAEGSSNARGLNNSSGAEAVLRGGSFTALGGSGRGIDNSGSDTTLEATSVTALVEGGSGFNYGLHNYNGAAAVLCGGSFTGRGGSEAYGIYNHDSGTTLEAESVTALAEGSSSNYGLNNSSGAEAVLRGGSFTGRGGANARGIDNSGSDTTLEATSVTALAEGGSSSNYGLRNDGGAGAVLRGGSFTGRGGSDARGISVTGGTLEAESVTALAEGGSSSNYGLYQLSGTVRLGVTQLDGGAYKTGGTLTCFQVYDGSYAPYTCPP